MFKTATTTSPKPSVVPNDKTRSNAGPPTGPSSQTVSAVDGRRSNTQTAMPTPSGPRAQLGTVTEKTANGGVSSTKLAMDRYFVLLPPEFQF